MSNAKAENLKSIRAECLTAMAENLKSKGELEE